MKPLVPALVLSTLLLTGCATTPRLTLQQIQPKRVFALTKADIFETVRFFSIKEAFRVDSFDEESGRIVGHRTQQSVTSDETGKMIIMNIRVVPVDAGHSEVTTRFTFSSLDDALTREQEDILMDCYTLLYDYLERKAE